MKMNKRINLGRANAAAISLGVIWLTGLACMVTVWVFFQWSGTRNALSNPWFTIKGNKEELQSIDELLLSSQEVEEQGRKSFVNVALRPDRGIGLADLDADKNRKQIYNVILGKKLQEVQKKRGADFSIGPVPQ